VGQRLRRGIPAINLNARLDRGRCQQSHQLLFCLHTFFSIVKTRQRRRKRSTPIVTSDRRQIFSLQKKCFHTCFAVFCAFSVRDQLVYNRIVETVQICNESATALRVGASKGDVRRRIDTGPYFQTGCSFKVRVRDRKHQITRPFGMDFSYSENFLSKEGITILMV
jgi:hypothetical protein